MIKVLVNGARGRMGQYVVAAVEREDDLELVGATDLGDDLGSSIESSAAEVVVDFTHPGCALSNCETILDSAARPVIGTTGFSPEDIDRLIERSAELGRGGLIAPNFAIGAVLLMKFAADASRFLPDVEIVELHHDRKADAPSGTAIKTAELIHEARGDHRSGPEDERETIERVRGGRRLDVPIHSIRLPGLVAHQEVVFGGVGQTLTMRHDSISRESFMPGVVLAARKVMALSRIEYGLERVLDL